MEYVYFDKATTDMLLKKDNNPADNAQACFGMDEMGTLHIVYKRDGGTVRDFIIPSDPEPDESEKHVIQKMESSMNQKRVLSRIKLVMVLSFAGMILAATMLLLNYLK